MIKIGLSGNIASGKTQAEKIFKKYGFKTLCLDDITAKIYKYDFEFQKEIKAAFNTINKSEISAIVFHDTKKLELLESIIYPKIKKKMFEFFRENSNEKATIVSSALLFEKNFNIYFDKIIFISAEKNLRLKRLMKRSGYSENEALLRINTQAPEDSKIKKSDFIIYNNSDLKNLENGCMQVIKELNFLL